MKHLLLLAGFLTITLCIHSQTLAKNVYFAVDSVHLSDENVVMLEKAFQSMTEGDRVTFRVLIRDDVKNRTSINELNRKRSIELQDFFLAEGIPVANIKMIKTPGREAKGFISDDMKNLIVYDVEVYKALGSVQFTSSDNIGLLDDSAEMFSVSADSEKEIQGAKGVSIVFPAAAFEFKTGLQAHGDIQIELKEFLKSGEIAGAGLVTMNGLTPLKAQGIIWLKASSSGKELRLKKGKMIQVKFPALASLPEPQLYFGKEINGVINLVQGETRAKTDAQNTAIYSSKLHWIAAAGPDKETGTASLNLKTNVAYPISIRLLMKENNQVIAAIASAGAKEATVDHIYPNQKAVLIAYGLKDGKIYFYSKELTTSVDGKEKIQLKESSLPEIKSFLSQIGK